MTLARLVKRTALAALFLLCIAGVMSAVALVMSLSDKLGRYGYALPFVVGLVVYAWYWAGLMLKKDTHV